MPSRGPMEEHCPLCGEPGPAWAFFAKGLSPEDPRFEVRRCPSCGFGLTVPALPASKIGAYYPPAYYGRDNVRFHWSIEALVRLFRLRRAWLISRLCEPGPVLDMGCGRGILLSSLRRAGYEPLGVEISDQAAWHARERLKLEVRTGDFLALPLPEEHFTAVVFWHSLEHLKEPLKALRRARTLLRRGGLLVVAVPNSESWQARLTGRNWFHLDVPRHYAHFGLKSLERALTREGFELARMDHFSFEQNPYGWLQSLYNAAGFEFNFLYSIIKDRSSRSTPILRHPAQALAILLLLPVFLPLSILLTVLEAAFQRGGTIEAYAVKK